MQGQGVPKAGFRVLFCDICFNVPVSLLHQDGAHPPDCVAKAAILKGFSERGRRNIVILRDDIEKNRHQVAGSGRKLSCGKGFPPALHEARVVDQGNQDHRLARLHRCAAAAAL